MKAAKKRRSGPPKRRQKKNHAKKAKSNAKPRHGRAKEIGSREGPSIDLNCRLS